MYIISQLDIYVLVPQYVNIYDTMWPMSVVVLNHSTRRRMIIWARREGGRDTMELPQFEMTVRVEKIKLYPVNSYLVYPHGSVQILLDPVGGDQVNHEVNPADSSTCWYNSVPLARIQSNQYFK
jgi:hypothetical protein